LNKLDLDFSPYRAYLVQALNCNTDNDLTENQDSTEHKTVELAPQSGTKHQSQSLDHMTENSGDTKRLEQFLLLRQLPQKDSNPEQS
jgi:hypothetical protein